MRQPVNALVVSLAYSHREKCPGCGVDRHCSHFVRTEAGNGREATKTCFSCVIETTAAWRATGCEACAWSAERIETSIADYLLQGQTSPNTRPEAELSMLPQHEGCGFSW